MRRQRSLAGVWQFQLDPDGSLRVDALQPDRTIPAPLPWQAAFPDLRQYSGFAWYRRSFTLDEAWLAGELLLDFGAVDYWCAVYVNGVCVGEHEGGFTPFRLPIRAQAHAGENTLAVRVYDTVQQAMVIPRWAPDPQNQAGPPFDALSIPQGKQGWYVDWSGIWQDVTLSAVPPRYLDRVHVTTDIRSGQAEAAVRLAGAAQAARVTASLAGQTVEVRVAPGADEVRLALRVPDPALWTPVAPTLYELAVRLETEGGADALPVRFGFREITTSEGYLLLNGEPLYLLAALDQDLYPETIANVPSEDFLRDQFAKARHLGLNMLRSHIKPPDPRYLELADEMGLLVWAEIPSWRMFYPKTAAIPGVLALDDAIKTRVEDTLAEMIARAYNHPSLVIWTLVNEDWGTALSLSQADRAWLAQLYERCKQLDPTRLCVDNSPCPAPWGPERPRLQRRGRLPRLSQHSGRRRRLRAVRGPVRQPPTVELLQLRGRTAHRT